MFLKRILDLTLISIRVSVIDKTGKIKSIKKNKKSLIANIIAQILLDKLIDDRNIN